MDNLNSTVIKAKEKFMNWKDVTFLKNLEQMNIARLNEKRFENGKVIG